MLAGLTQQALVGRGLGDCWAVWLRLEPGAVTFRGLFCGADWRSQEGLALACRRVHLRVLCVLGLFSPFLFPRAKRKRTTWWRS